MKHDPDFDRTDSSKGGLLPDSIRKALVTGISAVFMTEEGIRNMLSDMRLPKDAMGYLVQQTERTRRELFRVISAELKGFLKTANLTQEVRKVMQGMKVEVRAELRFVEDKPHVTMQADVHEQPLKKTAKRSRRRVTKRRVRT